MFEFDTRQETTIVSQEIRLQSPDEADRLRWIVGGYFQDRNYDIDPQKLKFSPAGGAAFFGVGTAGNIVTQGRYDQTTLLVLVLVIPMLNILIMLTRSQEKTLRVIG